MTDHLDIANAYLALWNEADDAVRVRILAESWTADARYADPLMQGEGPAGISAMIGAARAHFPGHRFELSGTPDGHGPFTRFSSHRTSRPLRAAWMWRGWMRPEGQWRSSGFS